MNEFNLRIQKWYEVQTFNNKTSWKTMTIADAAIIITRLISILQTNNYILRKLAKEIHVIILFHFSRELICKHFIFIQNLKAHCVMSHLWRHRRCLLAWFSSKDLLKEFGSNMSKFHENPTKLSGVIQNLLEVSKVYKPRWYSQLLFL